MKNLIIISMFLSIVNLSYAQKPLKGGKLKKRINVIEKSIDNKQYEDAINLFFDNNNPILPENINDKQTEKYNAVKNIVHEKQQLFSLNAQKVEQFYKNYDEDRPCDAIGVELLVLNESNSFTTTRNQQKELILKISDVKDKCGLNDKYIDEIEDLIAKENYEAALSIFSLSKEDLKYFYSDDIKKLGTFKEELRKYHNTYDSIYNEIILDPQYSINNIDFSEMSYWLSENKIWYLETVIKNAPHLLKSLEGYSPIINAEYSKVEPTINQTLLKLKEFSKKNKPMSSAELNRFFSKRVSLSEIKKYANEIVGSYGNFKKVNCTINGIEKTFDYEKFVYLMDLDVVYYHSLGRKYNSELKRAMFKKTDLYKQLYDDMKSDYDALKNSYFYITDDINRSYNMRSKSFEIWGQVTDMENPQLGQNTQYIQYYSLALKKPYNIKKRESYDYNSGSQGHYLNTYWYVPLNNQSEAFKIEEAGESAKVLVLFKIFDTVENPNQNFIFATNKIMKANVKKVLLINEDNNHIAVQYTY